MSNHSFPSHSLTFEKVVEVLHNDGRVVIYSCNKGEEDFDAGDRWATARPVGAYTDLRVRRSIGFTLNSRQKSGRSSSSVVGAHF